MPCGLRRGLKYGRGAAALVSAAQSAGGRRTFRQCCVFRRGHDGKDQSRRQCVRCFSPIECGFSCGKAPEEKAEYGEADALLLRMK